ncbi:uncharacterized protein BDR25DRAFT_358786 [Lindgomyces ingoldianus]|uniref:Uncharacterized protein n=1 Tax=Lindgomyces ingoldianus TaxID=673940 RepID=A0ACB6QK22_9PLEO|nr:uncharacterized protein BDR25DRAFT_358786 [Lindgomyces ingoldianus]KAF2467231.1 hypothetical protein BDR25DRAFT_358786 [Lindgomyces ingoldianus]
MNRLFQISSPHSGKCQGMFVSILSLSLIWCYPGKKVQGVAASSREKRKKVGIKDIEIRHDTVRNRVLTMPSHKRHIFLISEQLLDMCEKWSSVVISAVLEALFADWLRKKRGGGGDLTE